MDYGNLLTKAWNTIWNNKFLIVLGILASIGQGGGGGNGGGGSNYNVPSGPRATPSPGNFPPPNFGPEFQQVMRQIGPMLIAVIVIALCVGLTIGIALWVLRRTAEGGLISGVNTIDGGGTSSFSVAFSAGWGKIWRMLLISLIAAIPGLILVVVVAAMIISFVSGAGGRELIQGLQSNNPSVFSRAIAANTGFVIAIVAVCCPLFLVGGVLAAIRTFADRACITEDKGVIESYQRGLQVLRENLGPAILLFLIQFGIGIVLSFVLLVPSILIAFCCLLWPLLWVISGTVQSYFSTLWTLAWREWTGGNRPMGEPVSPAPAPAV